MPSKASDGNDGKPATFMGMPHWAINFRQPSMKACPNCATAPQTSRLRYSRRVARPAARPVASAQYTLLIKVSSATSMISRRPATAPRAKPLDMALANVAMSGVTP